MATTKSFRRRWSRFTLRTLLALLTLCGVALGWTTHAARSDLEVERELAKHKVFVTRYCSRFPLLKLERFAPTREDAAAPRNDTLFAMIFTPAEVDVMWRTVELRELVPHLKRLPKLQQVDIGAYPYRKDAALIHHALPGVKASWFTPCGMGLDEDGFVNEDKTEIVRLDEVLAHDINFGLNPEPISVAVP